MGVLSNYEKICWSLDVACLKNNNTQDRLAQIQVSLNHESNLTLTQSAHHTIHASSYQIFTNSLNKCCYPLTGGTEAQEAKMSHQSHSARKWWKQVLTQKLPHTPSLLLCTRKIQGWKPAVCAQGSRYARIPLWYNVITCAICHIKIGEIRRLRSQDLGLLSHRN